MTITIDINSGPNPKRGDLIHTNVGNKRERTCFIVKVKPLRMSRFRVIPDRGASNDQTARSVGRQGVESAAPRFRLTAVRWWEIEPEFRNLLFRHAERNGGQHVIWFKRYPARKKLTFEGWMRMGDAEAERLIPKKPR